MTSRPRHHSLWKAAKSAGRTVNQSGKYAEKAAVGLGRWATTDHTGATKLVASLPDLGFFNTLSIILVHVVAMIVGAMASGILLALLITHGITALFSF